MLQKYIALPVSVGEPPLLRKLELFEKVNTEPDIAIVVVALIEPLPKIVQWTDAKLVVDDCSFSVVLFVDMFSDVKLHDWHVKFLVMELLPPVKAPFKRVILLISVVSTIPDGTINVYALQYNA